MKFCMYIYRRVAYNSHNICVHIENMASSEKYRSYLNPEETKDTKWRFGAPPNYEVVDKLFEQGRIKVSLFLSHFI